MSSLDADSSPLEGIYVTGTVRDVLVFDIKTLQLRDRITSIGDNVFTCARLIPICSSDSRPAVGVSGTKMFGSESSKVVSIIDCSTKECVNEISVASCWGIACISISSRPVLVSSDGRSLISYCPVTGNMVTYARDVDSYVLRIASFPQLSPNEVYVGGCVTSFSSQGSEGLLERYAIDHECVMLGSYVGHVGHRSCSVNAMAACHDKNILLSVTSFDNCRGDLKLWSRDSFECLSTVSLCGDGFSMAYTPETHLVSCGLRSYNMIEVFDIRNLSERVHSLQPGDSSFGSIHEIDQITPTLLSSCSSEGIIATWNPVTGKVVRSCVTEGRVYGLCVFPKKEFECFDSVAIEDEMERIEFLLGVLLLRVGERRGGGELEIVEVDEGNERVIVRIFGELFGCLF